MTMWMKRLGSRKERAFDPEFQRLKTELTNVATALETAVRGLERLSGDVSRMFGGVTKFASDFHSLYPSDDGVRRLGAAAVTSTERLGVASTGEAPHAARIADLERGIRAYLAEIDCLRREFRSVAAARSEADAARDRAERLASRRTPDEARCAHARTLAEDRSRAYLGVMRALHARLASTYRKHGSVFQAAYAAYMLRLDSSVRLLDKHMGAHRAHAFKLEKSLGRTELSKSPSMHA